MGSWPSLIVALALVTASGSVAAEPPALALRWEANRGTLQPGRIAGSFVLGTDASPGRFSEALALASAEVDLPYRLDVTWRRLGPEAGRSLHVQVVGGVVLIRTGMVGLYAYDEAAFAASGWTPVPSLRSHARHRVTVTQDAHAVAVAVDGVAVARWPLAAARPRGRVGVGGKGARGYRSRIFVEAVTVRPAQ